MTSPSTYPIVKVIDEPPHLTIGPLMIWIHRRAYPFIDDWCDQNWLLSTCSIRIGEETISLTGSDAASDELSEFLSALQRLRDHEDRRVAYYPSSQAVLIDVVQADDDRFAVALRHLSGGRVGCEATRLDLHRWISELQAILHVFPKITSQSLIGQPYGSRTASDHLAPNLTRKCYREFSCPNSPDVSTTPA